MAYASTVAVEHKGTEIIVTIAETDAATTDVTTIIQLPCRKFRILRQKCQLVSGTGTTVDPLLVRNNSDTTGNAVVLENDTAAAIIDNAIPDGYATWSTNGALYHRSAVNDATADHVINTEYLIKVGW